MDLTQVTILVLIGIFRIIPGNEPCKFGMNCDYPCHCQNDETCDINDGSCPSGCDDGDLMNPGDFWYTGAWYGYGCQIGNVAYDKDAIQGPATSLDRVASRAVDGNHDPDLRGGSCTHTAGTAGQTGWWEVDLMGDYVVLAVNLTNRIDCGNQCRDRTRDLDITVSGSRGVGAVYDLCKRVGNEGRADATYAECQQPLRGRYVRLERLPNSYQKNIINLCEIQVYGYLYSDCLDGYSGVACGTSCNCKEPCDDISGECVGQMCMEGWQGTDCQTECPSGAWGSNCAANCNCMNTTEACDRFVGRCMSGCASGYDGVGCNEPCPSGTWGSNCLKMCNCVNEDETCDRFNGRCMSGCSSGFRGDGCDLRCSPGTWGLNCGKTCNCMNEAEACNHIYGRCMSGCTPGYGGVGCNLILPRLSGMVEFSNASSSTIGISFSAWSRDNSGEEMPTGYIIQHRSHGTMVWTDALNVDHNADMTQYSVLLEGLEPGTMYYIRVVPFIEDAGVSYRGTPTEDASYETLSASADGQAKSDLSATIAGVVCFIIVGILVVVVVVFLRRRYKRQKPDNEELEVTVIDELSQECTENGYEKPVNVKADGGTKGALSMNNGSAQYENVMIEAPSSVPMDDDEHIYGNQDLVGRPLKVDELALYIEEMSGRKDAFKEEFSEIPSGMTASAEDGKKAANRNLNRFNNICAYDHSRVVLKIPADGSRTDYINANYIAKYGGDSKGYIASQGPKKSTLIDMWSMVWQTDANRIVMLTNLCESGKTKCEQYWPDSGVADYGWFKVTLVDTEVFADYTLRVLSLVHTDGGSRPVYQFHFTAWPDSEVPELATSLLDFRRKVRSHDGDAKGPLIVHCSAGIGRTGTFLALDYLLDQLETEGMVDVLSYTTIMRTNRVDMIQTLAQYKFVYKTLLEAAQTGETTIPSNVMEARYTELKQSQKNGKSKTEEQFTLLRCLEQQQKLSSNDGAVHKENLAKNRDKNIVPLDKHRPFLTSIVDETNNYINAVFVGGYRQRRAYIATQHPLPNTVVDLWRLLYEHKCSSIITLEQPGPGGEDTPVFWPTEKDSPFVLNQLSVTLLKEEDLDEGIIKLIEFEITVDKQNPHTVRMYQFLHWDVEPALPSPENTVKLLDHAERWQLRSGHGTICFQCKYGYERCGLMIAASYMLEKLKVDREVDVFQAVKQVRIPRPQLVTSLAQYEFLHELAIAYINSCEDYANFK